MKILLSGAHGLVGSSLIPYLTSKGHNLFTLVRSRPVSPSEIQWDPLRQGPDPETLNGFDAVIHLAGESIAAGRWTAARKAAIRHSREVGTKHLVDSLQKMSTPPKVFICASAIGFYGDRGEEVLTEDSAAGSGFLPDVCKAWEAAAATAGTKGSRVVQSRFGIILSPKGGALAKMLFPFKMGVGGILGSGRQYMSWIALDDVLACLAFLLDTDSMQGPVNVVSPEPATNHQFTKTLGRVLKRPTVFPMPAVAARLVFGEMADALLLSSSRVQPSKLSKAGFRFQWADLESALHHLLNK